MRTSLQTKEETKIYWKKEKGARVSYRDNTKSIPPEHIPMT